VKLRRLRHEMRHPGGSSNGVRWRPLALWVGWPRGSLSMLTAVIMRESSGRERASNGGVYLGLLQIWRAHVKDPGRLFEAEYNLRVGLRLYRHSGWSPWAQTAY